MYSMVPFRMHRSLSRPTSMLSSFFDDQFLRSFFNMNDMMSSFGFRVDIRENDCSYLMEAELPGVDEKNIELSVENDVLTISANLNEERKDERNCYSERRYGHTSRSFSLEGIDQDNIVASHKNGILYITLPKEKPEEKKTARKISINTNCGQDHCDCDNQ
ncbi:MAG: Hsp20/alpha crystallin family protein [Clostridia bacterium]|nr:Hsp20/alpha crystallin family protein [Clostridia bacterium]